MLTEEKIEIIISTCMATDCTQKTTLSPELICPPRVTHVNSGLLRYFVVIVVKVNKVAVRALYLNNLLIK